MPFPASPGRGSDFLRGAPTFLPQIQAHAELQDSAPLSCMHFVPGLCRLLRPFSQMNQSSKRVSSKWGATIPMTPEVAQAPGDDCTQMPCGISQAAQQTGPDECPPTTFLPLSLTAAHGDFLQHVRQRLPV